MSCDESEEAPLIEAALRHQRRSALVEEANRLAEDPVASAERRAVMDDMESISAEWPE